MFVNTPPMSWNTWNTFGPNINEKLILESADAMVENGLLDAAIGIWSSMTSGRSRNAAQMAKSFPIPRSSPMV